MVCGYLRPQLYIYIYIEERNENEELGKKEERESVWVKK